MAVGRYGAQPITDRFGVPLPDLTVTIYLTGTTTKAALFTDDTGTVSAPNPMTTDASGNLTFFATPGDYDINGNGATVTVSVPPDASLTPSMFLPVSVTSNYNAKPWDFVSVEAESVTVLLPETAPLGSEIIVYQATGDAASQFNVAVNGVGYINGKTDIAFVTENVGGAFSQWNNGARFIYMGTAVPNPSGRTFPTWIATSIVGGDGDMGMYLSGPLFVQGSSGFGGPIDTEAGLSISNGAGSFPHAGLFINGNTSVRAAMNSVAVNYTITEDDFIVVATAALTATFPFTRTDQIVALKNTSGGSVTVAAGAGATLGSEVTTTLTTGKVMWLIAIGTVWHTLVPAG